MCVGGVKGTNNTAVQGRSIYQQSSSDDHFSPKEQYLFTTDGFRDMREGMHRFGSTEVRKNATFMRCYADAMEGKFTTWHNSWD